jgi:hypothetical protein
MLEPVVVWKVELRRGRDPVDVEGTLTLTDDALVFEDLDGDTTSIDFSEIDRARRQRMSPILLVRHRDTSLGETAFYFAQPPPLGPPDPATLSLREATRRRPSKRRQQRDNTGYLSTKGTVLKPTIQAWVDEVRAKVIAARDGAPG